MHYGGSLNLKKTVLVQNENRTYNAGKYQNMKLFGISRKSLILDVLLGSECSRCDHVFIKTNSRLTETHNLYHPNYL